MAAKRPSLIPPLSFGHPKADILLCFGKNVMLSSDSSSSKSPTVSSGVFGAAPTDVVLMNSDEPTPSPTLAATAPPQPLVMRPSDELPFPKAES